jgi:hypothetical protein
VDGEAPPGDGRASAIRAHRLRGAEVTGGRDGERDPDRSGPLQPAPEAAVRVADLQLQGEVRRRASQPVGHRDAAAL